jgi:hypothetical protein
VSIGAIEQRMLTKPIATLREHHETIMSALDFVFTGV